MKQSLFHRNVLTPRICLQKFNYSQKNSEIPNNHNLGIPLSLRQTSHINKLLDIKTKISKLANGLTVVSQNQFDVQCSIGVVVKSAPRYESRYLSGVSHFIQKLSFQSTVDFKSKNDIQTVLDKCSAYSDCQLLRDIIIYFITGKTDRLEDLVVLLSEVVLRPQITSKEMENARQMVGLETQDAQMMDKMENVMLDLIFQAAYYNNTLGLPRYTPQENTEAIQRTDIITFMASTFRPESMVVIGIGVDHSDLVKYASKSFLPKTNYISTNIDIKHEIVGLGPDLSTPQMTGGEIKLERDLSRYRSPELAHVSLALESCSITDPQYVPIRLLQTLTGGVGSFSTSGSEMEMYSRLYTEVLNQHHWANNAVVSNHCYSDTGLFIIAGNAQPKDIESMVLTLAKQLKKINKNIDSAELARIKCQLKLILLLNLEMRPGIFEDIGRQVLYDEFRNTVDYFEQIDKVTESDIRDLTERMLLNRVAMASCGNLKNLPSFDNVQTLLTSSERFIPRVFNKFF